MSLIYNEIQANIKLFQPNALYIHCGSHNLNLVINDAVGGIVDVQVFFVTTESIYTSFWKKYKQMGYTIAIYRRIKNNSEKIKAKKMIWQKTSIRWYNEGSHKNTTHQFKER